MTRTPEKLVELYIAWRKYSFPEWARSKQFDISGLTSQDPATRKKLSIEGRELIKELSAASKNTTNDVDVDLRLCIDDAKIACDQLESDDMGIREIIDLIAPDPDEKPWIENERWSIAAKTLPRSLARAQASGPWVKEVFLHIAEELDEHINTRDKTRSNAAKSARDACIHMANAVGYRPTTKQKGNIPKGTWALAQNLVKRDKQALDNALSNVLPSVLPEVAFQRINENIEDRGRLLGLAETWSNTLREAVENSGWALVPKHEPASVLIMPKSRSYTQASIKNVSKTGATVFLAMPNNNVTLPLTIAHETYPGHLLQKIYQLNAQSEAMRLFGSSTSSEGWAHYAESKINELGLPNSSMFNVGLAHRSLLRSVRLLARTGIVERRLEPETVLRLFKDIALLPHDIAIVEAKRVQWDHKTIDYALGKLAIENMQKEFVDRGMGDEITFRMKILPILSAPLDLIAKRLGLRIPNV